MTKLNRKSTKYGLRPNEVAAMLGSEQLYREVSSAGWIKPVVDRHRLKLYDRGQVQSAWSRMVGGEKPPQIPRRSRATGSA